MTTFHATCHTPDNLDLDRRIQGLGSPVWGKLTIDSVISLIDQGNQFYTAPPNGQGQLIVTAIHPVSLRRYIKTVADGVTPNNILALPRCL
jgi:hypothetical protein